MPTEKDEQGCFYVSSARHKRVFFMIEEGRVSRIDVDTRGVSNDKGLQVGDSERQVLDRYGRALKVSQNPYSEAKVITNCLCVLAATLCSSALLVARSTPSDQADFRRFNTLRAACSSITSDKSP